jgi:hypothetical protein
MMAEPTPNEKLLRMLHGSRGEKEVEKIGRLKASIPHCMQIPINYITFYNLILSLWIQFI